jgi:TolB protein
MMQQLLRAGAICALVGAQPMQAQWTNRYPKVGGYSHHVYLEGFELPLLTSGPIDAVESPDGTQVAFASRGYLWLFNPTSGVATRATHSAGVDSRPTWSPDGSTLAFLRDDSRRLSIVSINLRSGAETQLVSDSAMVLDPSYAPDGKSLYYSSALAGDLDLWRLDLATRQTTRLTTTIGAAELEAMPTPDGRALIYLSKSRGGVDAVRRRTLDGSDDRVLLPGGIISMTRGAVSPDGRMLALTWPNEERWELRLIGASVGGQSVQLFADRNTVPLTPSFSRDGRSIWFSRADSAQRMHLMRIPAAGGAAVDVPITTWNWGVPMARLRIVTRRAAGQAPVGARVSVRLGDTHPVVADSSQMRFDGQNGIAFFYSPGVTVLDVPAGVIDVMAVQGLATPPAVQHVTAAAGETTTVDLTLTPVWDARASGWLSGEHHFHLNYGGPYHLAPDALLAMGGAEDLDVLTPMLANLAMRFEDQSLFSYQHVTTKPWVIWSQEVRSHFLGHVGLVGSNALFWPWIWGPGYDVNARDDRPNADALAWTRSHGGFNVYVHPVPEPNPFRTAGSLRGLPVSFVADAVQGHVDAIELACLWSDERGTADLWYRMLNVGVPIALSAGTDVMNNLYRTMAIGTTRVYVKPTDAATPAGYFAALRAGRSFVTNGPLLEFTVDAAGPGEIVKRTSVTKRWSLTVHTAVPVDSVAIVVNGTVVQHLQGFPAPGSKVYTGVVALPAGGWIAARVSGPATDAWPAMDSYAYAHTAPIWIDRIGSTEPRARDAAAHDLLRALDVANQAINIGYSDALHPRLTAHITAARQVVTGWLAKE